MIQRIQSVWLLLVSAFSAITFRFPFYTGDWTKDLLPNPVNLDADLTIPIMILTIAIALLALVTIFLFRDRKLQIRLCYLGIVLTLGLLALYFLEMQNFTSGSIALWSIFTFAILAFYIMATRGIRRDQRIIRSLDRLR